MSEEKVMVSLTKNEERSELSDILSKLFFYVLIFLVVSCDSWEREKNRYKDKEFVIVKNIDKFVDIVLDKEGSVYIRSSISEQCGLGKYFYNSTLVLGGSSSKDIVEVSLSSRVDLNSLKLAKVNERYYKFEDIKYTYSLYLTMCESHMVVDLK